jgi:uncharacterized membrane protein
VTPETRVAPRRATGLILTSGTVLGATCFAIALVADLARLGGHAFTGGDAAGYVAALLSLDPEAWAALGSALIIATPAVGLVVTAVEYGSIGDRRAVVFAVAVLAVLSFSLLIALLT